jgi:hypothetical protein
MPARSSNGVQTSSSIVRQGRRVKNDARDELIRLLEREMLRKDNALAEASALLILPKKST